MQIGERGFTYLWLLFVLAAGGAALGLAGQRWSGIVQRERERELLFRGEQIAVAISAYRAASGVAETRWPRSLDELVEDRRGLAMQRHLRRAWTDPFTGEADWVPIPAEGGGWRGVHSRSEAPARLVREDPDAPAARPPRTVAGHRFVAPAPAHPASAPLSPAPPADDFASAPR